MQERIEHGSRLSTGAGCSYNMEREDKQMKRKTVLVIYNEEELQKVNDQLAFMQEQPILNSGKFPRYFKVTENEFEEILGPSSI